MCGIAGTFGDVKPRPEVWLPLIRHRGPDGEGTWNSPTGSAALAHSRLAIIDPLPEAAQPMASVCGRWHLVYNGEIYNFRELRAELASEGATFATNSDTEVLLQGLALHGSGFLPRLAGMFAFAFWDEKDGTGLLARDPFGIKPLYYRHEHDGILQFASEFRALRREDDKPDGESMREFLLWGSVPEPNTVSFEVRQLGAGCLLWWAEGEVRIECWAKWDGRTTGRRDYATKALNRGESVRRTRAALEESVRRHLVSDVPVGIFLSGGIDSTAILALARRELGPGADLRTFSIGFDDPAYDESCLARRTAEHFGARHVEWRMTAAEGAAEIGPFLAAVDQPCTDGFNSWCVSKLARREGMKVVLSGLGGDEFFGGYKSFRQVPAFRLLHGMAGPVRSALAFLADRAGAGSPWHRLAAYLRNPGGGLGAYHALRGQFTDEEAQRLVLALTGKKTEPAAWTDREDCPTSGREMVGYLEVTRYLRNQLLRDSDVFSMAHGLELRVPFVDVRLAETLSSIPPEIRLRPGKKLLLEAVPEIPDWIRGRPKRGFRFPFQEWIEGAFGDQLRHADAVAPFLLATWYRRWAVVALLRELSHRPAVQ